MVWKCISAKTDSRACTMYIAWGTSMGTECWVHCTLHPYRARGIVWPGGSETTPYMYTLIAKCESKYIHTYNEFKINLTVQCHKIIHVGCQVPILQKHLCIIWYHTGSLLCGRNERGKLVSFYHSIDFDKIQDVLIHESSTAEEDVRIEMSCTFLKSMLIEAH